MNIKNASEHLPLRRLVYTEYGEFKKGGNGEKRWFNSYNLKVQVCRGGSTPADFKEFEDYRDLSFESQEAALATAVLFTERGFDNWDVVWDSGDASGLECPQYTNLMLMQFAITEYVYGRDTGNSWSDPENDIRKKAKVEYRIRQGWKGNIVEFGTGASGITPWAVCEAYRNCVRVMEACFPSKEEQKDIVAFEWNDRVYGDPCFRDGSPSVIGKPIDGREVTPLPFPGDGRDRGENADVNYLCDYVFWQKRNEIYIVGGNFFLDGELILNVHQFVQRAGIKWSDDHDLYMIKSSICENMFYRCEHVLDWIREHYPEATQIHGDHGFWSMCLERRHDEPCGAKSD